MSDSAGEAVNIFDPKVAACPHASYQQLVRDQPVMRSPLGGLVISRYEDVRFALRSPEIFSSEMSEQMAASSHFRLEA